MAIATAFSEETVKESASKQLDSELLRRLYAYMVKCRMVEERIRVL